MTVRLVATDLDGTLLRSDGSLSERTRRALQRVIAAGVEVVVVTARPPRFVDALARLHGLSGIAVCGNGAMVYDIAARTALAARTIPTDAARRAARALSEVLPGVGFAVETGHQVLMEPRCRWQLPKDTAAVVRVADAGELWRADVPIVKLLAWSADGDADAMLAAARRAAVPQVHVTHSGGRGLLEMSAPGVTKESALAALCAARGIDAATVAAFGDMPNDLGFLAWAGAGYAVANAHPEVLVAVRRHTATNDEDGVAAVLEELFEPEARRADEENDDDARTPQDDAA